MKPHILLYFMGGFFIGFGASSTMLNHDLVGFSCFFAGLAVWMFGYLEHSTLK